MLLLDGSMLLLRFPNMLLRYPYLSRSGSFPGTEFIKSRYSILLVRSVPPFGDVLTVATLILDMMAMKDLVKFQSKKERDIGKLFEWLSRNGCSM